MKWVELQRNDGAMPRWTSGRRQAALQKGVEGRRGLCRGELRAPAQKNSAPAAARAHGGRHSLAPPLAAEGWRRSPLLSLK
jgi:hypothetical protein